MASTFVSLPKPFFAFPVKTISPPSANQKLLGTEKKNLKPIMFRRFPCSPSMIFVFFPNVSAGSRRGCLRIKAISTKWEPTKVLPFFPVKLLLSKVYAFRCFNSWIVEMINFRLFLKQTGFLFVLKSLLRSIA